MLAGLDGFVIGTPLGSGLEAFSRLGFLFEESVHGDSAFAFMGSDLLELSASEAPGPRRLVVESDDLGADIAAMRARGVTIGDPVELRHETHSGATVHRRHAHLGGVEPLPISFVQWLGPKPQRREHPNGALRLDRAYIAVADVAAAAALYARVLGMAEPNIERGMVIKADMAVFNLGPTGLTVAQPAESGPAAEALTRQGPGPFQALYRTSSMDAADRWMVAHGLPSPDRATRNTGEQAILVSAEHACGTYVGLVGPS